MPAAKKIITRPKTKRAAKSKPILSKPPAKILSKTSKIIKPTVSKDLEYDTDESVSSEIADQIASLSPEELLDRLDSFTLAASVEVPQKISEVGPLKKIDTLDPLDTRAIDTLRSDYVLNKIGQSKFANELQLVQRRLRRHIIHKLLPVSIGFENAVEDAQMALRTLSSQHDAKIDVTAPRAVMRVLLNESLVHKICDLLGAQHEHGTSLLEERRTALTSSVSANKNKGLTLDSVKDLLKEQNKQSPRKQNNVIVSPELTRGLPVGKRR